MRKILKNVSILLLPVILVSLLIFSYNLIKLEYKFAHQSAHVYQHSFSWQKYLILSEFQDFYNKISENRNQTNLPKVDIYISEQSSKKLLSSLPNSTKEWVDAFVTYPGYKMQRIKLRYRGDNPNNWLKSKKNFKTKTKKNQLINNYRNRDYFPFNSQTFFPYLISKEMNLLTPEFKLVEVYFNGESKGLYLEVVKLDEMFLRKENLMPVNIYKGENHATEFHLGLNRNLFNNPSMWSKLAVFNQENIINNTDLGNFFKTLMLNQAKPDSSLGEHIDLDYFSKFDAFLTLTSNVHHDWFHNMRLILDPWSGKVTQLITDPSIISIHNLKTLNNSLSEGPDLDFSSNDLNSFLNKNVEYVHKKYKWLYYFLTEKDVTLPVKEYFESLKNDLTKVSKKEFYFLKYMNNTSASHKQDAQEMISILYENKDVILKILESNPKSSWGETEKGLELSIDAYTPLSDLILSFDDLVPPKWVGIDTNYNNFIDKNEPKFFNYKNSKMINVPVVLYSNRLKKSNQQTNIEHSYKIDHAKTSFKLITEKNIKPNKIESKNFFNGNIFTIKNELVEDSVKINKYNNIIFTDQTEEKFELYMSGNILVDKDLIINKKTMIEPGTVFSIMPNKNIIFKKQVIAEGSESKPIIFKKFIKDKKKVKPWGTVALIGQKTEGSIFSHTFFEGGSGGKYNQFFFSSMFSIHDTSNIKISNSNFESNEIYDDTIHIVYSKNILLKNIKVLKAYRDAIDIDISKDIFIENLEIDFSNNDGLDFMESEAEITNVKIKNSKDKGISVGENSKIVIRDSKLSNNVIGIAIKDKSLVRVYNSHLNNNGFQIAAYAKNWMYGGGGNIEVYSSNFKAKKNYFSTSVDPEDIKKKPDKALIQNSKINIFNSEINGEKKVMGKNFFIN